MPGTGRPGGQPDGGDHRQPEREERRKRGRSIDACGYDAGKKIKGKKRHLLVDTEGLLLCAIVHAADVQDRDGGDTADERAVRPVPVPVEALRRRRLSGTKVPTWTATCLPSGQRRDRQAL